MLTAGVSRSPLLLSMASAINVLAGGVPLLPQARMDVGGLAYPQAREQLPGDAGQSFNYERLAWALSKVKIEIKVSNIRTALAKDDFTNSISNS